MRKWVKRFICALLYFSGWINLSLRREKGGVLRILVYHRIIPEGKSISPAVSRKNFLKQLEYLKKHYRVISLDEGIRRFKEKNLPPRTVCITFDDGYRDVFTEAFPCLKKFNLPFTLFLSSGLIEEGKLSWTEKINQAVENTTLSFLKLSWKGGISYPLRSFQEKKIFCEKIEEELLQVSPSLREKIMEEILSQTGESKSPSLMLNWDEIKKMWESGLLGLGSHSLTHPVMIYLSEEELKKEVVLSKKLIQEKISAPVKGFSYPSATFDERVIEKIKEADYEYALDVGGQINKYDQDLYQLKRIHIEDEPLYVFACEVKGILSFLRRKIVFKNP